jgi:hypothetical protein
LIARTVADMRNMNSQKPLGFVSESHVLLWSLYLSSDAMPGPPTTVSVCTLARLFNHHCPDIVSTDKGRSFDESDPAEQYRISIGVELVLITK